jgi:hypothetical protein
MELLNELRFNITLMALIPAIIALFFQLYNYNNLYDPSLAYWGPFCVWLLFYMIFKEASIKDRKKHNLVNSALNINYLFISIFVLVTSLNGVETIAGITNPYFIAFIGAIISFTSVGLAIIPSFLILFFSYNSHTI